MSAGSKTDPLLAKAKPVSNKGDITNSPEEVLGCTQLEATVLLERYDLVAITEIWWDESHDWSVTIDGYRLFRRDRGGKRGGEVALYIKRWIECEELSLKNSHVQVESTSPMRKD
ncbi:nipped-b-like protein [Pitangus sulphuratus]|nr:nipped-b-like protein [Pitangus sulphuratus]